MLVEHITFPQPLFSILTQPAPNDPTEEPHQSHHSACGQTGPPAFPSHPHAAGALGPWRTRTLVPRLPACQLESGTSYQGPRPMALRLLQHQGVCKGCSGGEVAGGRTCGGRLQRKGRPQGATRQVTSRLQRWCPLQSAREVRLVTPGAWQSNAGCERSPSCLPISGADWTQVAGLTSANVMCASKA